jgi:hypothetical protein
MNTGITKTLLVMANSIKKGGRCVAGLEIAHTESDGYKLEEWIRPVDANQDEGTIPIHRTIIAGLELKTLDLVKIRFTRPANDPLHPEDFEIDTSVKWQSDGAMTKDVLERLADESEDLWRISFDGSRKVAPKTGQKTLWLIKPKAPCQVLFFRDDTPWGVKYRRLLFIENENCDQTFSIDDPEFMKRHNLSPESLGNRGRRTIDLDPSRTVIVASLTKPYKEDGMQYKIAATIFEL